MVTLLRTNSDNQDFINLVRLLDADLAVRDGSEHAFYSQFNKIDSIRYVVVAYMRSKPVGCGAIKGFSPGIMEIKRMFVMPEVRNNGVATRVLMELERWAKEMSNRSCILETGKRQPEAIGLYTRNGYRAIPNYGQYKGMENSLCFEKQLM
jgi:GNAT superfamily N-acetyltransferase